MLGTIRALIPLIMVLTSLSATAHDAHPHESSSSLLDLEIHPTVVWPGEIVTVRLWYQSSAGNDSGYRVLPRPNNAVPMTNRFDEKGFDQLSLTIFNLDGDLLASHQFWTDRIEAQDGGSPNTVEWQWRWDAAKIAPSECIAIIQANGPGRPTEVAEHIFWLGPSPADPALDMPADDTIPSMLDCAITVRPMRVHPGETVQVCLTVTNPDTVVARRFFPDYQPFGYEIIDDHGQVVAASDRADPDEGEGRLKLEPGETRERIWTWTWIPPKPCRKPWDGIVLPQYSVASGRYDLRAGLGGDGARESAPMVELALWSPPAFFFDLNAR